MNRINKIIEADCDDVMAVARAVFRVDTAAVCISEGLLEPAEISAGGSLFGRNAGGHICLNSTYMVARRTCIACGLVAD